jgi:hypothetical protein
MSVLKVTGIVTPPMRGHFKPLMETFSHVFEEATGEKLFPGTLNVKVETPITIKEDFRILASKLGGGEQDLLFERCRIDGIAAYRLRRFNPFTGEGSHGDHILEISSSTWIPNSIPEQIDSISVES